MSKLQETAWWAVSKQPDAPPERLYAATAVPPFDFAVRLRGSTSLTPGPNAVRPYKIKKALAGRDLISARRCRDVCVRERSKSKKEHQVIRREYYIECTCGYKEPGLDGDAENAGQATPLCPIWL